MYKKSDAEVNQVIIISEDESSDVELAEEDKDLILELVTKEYFFHEYSDNLGTTYRCKQKCTICSENKPHFPSDENLLYELFIQRGEKVTLSQDDRLAIQKDLVHHFFKLKWEASIQQMHIVHDQNRNESNISKDRSDHDQSIMMTYNNKEKDHEAKVDVDLRIKIEEETKRIEDMKISRDDIKTQHIPSKDKREYQNDTATNEKEEINKFKINTESKIRKDKRHMVETKDISGTTPNNPQTERTRSKCDKECDQNSMPTNHKNKSNKVKTARIRNGEQNVKETKIIELASDDSRTKLMRIKGKQDYDENSTSTDEKDILYFINGAKINRKHYVKENSKDDKMETSRNERSLNKSTREYDKKNLSVIDRETYHEFRVYAKSTTRNDKHQEEVETARDDSITKIIQETEMHKSTIRHAEESRKMSYQQIPPPHHTMASMSGLTKDVNDLTLESSGNKPMDDPESKFFVDREFLDVEIYEDGLRNDNWNPTQSLYEISSKCGWGRPSYMIKRVDQNTKYLARFTCEVTVNGKTFVSDRDVAQKKTAQHLASAKLLNYVGFEFEYADKDAFKPQPIPPYDLTNTNVRYPNRLEPDHNSFQCSDEHGRPHSTQRYEETEKCSIKQRLGYSHSQAHSPSTKCDDFITQDVTYSLRKYQEDRVGSKRSSTYAEEFLCKRPRQYFGHEH